VSARKFAAGDRVVIKGFPFTDHTGTVVRRSRLLFRKVWVVELDNPGPGGQGIFRGPDRNLKGLDTDDDPRRLRQPSDHP